MIEDLSDWQLERVRDALRAYHSYTRDREGKRYTWEGVREAIAVEVGVEIGSAPRTGAEILRKFVQGIADKNVPGARTYQRPAGEALRAIIAFVTEESLELLSKEELQEKEPAAPALLRLTEYLDDGSSIGRPLPHHKLYGTYKDETSDGRVSCVRKLTLHASHDAHLIQVTETEERLQPILGFSDKQELTQIGQRRLSCIRFSGWAVLTPEDNLLFFLKNEQNQRNAYYYTVAAPPTLWQDKTPFDYMGLLRYDYPLPLNADDPAFEDNLWSSLMEEIGQNIRLSFAYPRISKSARETRPRFYKHLSALLQESDEEE